jgi:hypothetical protein
VSLPSFCLSVIGLTLHFFDKTSLACNDTVLKFFRFWHNRISLPILSWLFIPLTTIKTNVSVRKNEEASHSLLLTISSIIIALVIFYECRGAFFIKSSFVETTKKHLLYIPMLLGSLFLISVFFSAGFIGILSFVEPWILSLCLIGLIGFIYVRPYEGVLHNAGVIVAAIQVIFFLAWSILRRTDISMQT